MISISMHTRFLGILYRSYKHTRARTVKYTFSIATVAVFSLMAAVLLTNDTSYIRLDTPTESVSAGERFAVDVYAGAQTSVNAIDVAVRFPAALVEVAGIDTGESVISIWTEDPYVKNNAVILQGGTFRRGFVGEHLIARINLIAKVDGTAEFSVEDTTFLAGDGSGSEVENIAETPVLVVNVGEEGVLAGDIELTFLTDIDGDGDVSINDIQTFIGAWQERRWVYDFNADRKMNFTDFAIILADSFLR